MLIQYNTVNDEFNQLLSADCAAEYVRCVL